VIFHLSFADALPITADEIAAQTMKDPVLSEVHHKDGLRKLMMN